MENDDSGDIDENNNEAIGMIFFGFNAQHEICAKIFAKFLFHIRLLKH